jgi:ArsR family transcriptional regulator, arsenate/arsenite/antimonite-responsive transcriptional repressor / arsenate reductase (thioredoxin)
VRVDRGVEERARLHAALSDPVRLGIVDALLWSDRTPGELGHGLGVPSNLLAHHLDALADVELIERSVSHGDRRRRYVRLRPGPLTDLLARPHFEAAGVVFVCTRNSARSQLAAALWNATSDVPATSGGTEPADRIHPGARRAARRRGLDLGSQAPSRFEPEGGAGRLVVTVCDLAHEELARVEATTDLPVLHWSIADPAQDDTPEAFDAAADELARRIDQLCPAVVPAGPSRRSRSRT